MMMPAAPKADRDVTVLFFIVGSTSTSTPLYPAVRLVHITFELTRRRDFIQASPDQS